MHSLFVRRVSFVALAIAISVVLAIVLVLPRASEGAVPKKKASVMKKEPNSPKAPTKSSPSKKKLKAASVSSALDEDEDETLDLEDLDAEDLDDEDLDEEDEDLDDLEDIEDEGDAGAQARAADENVKEVAPWKVEDATAAIASQREVIAHVRSIVKEWKLEFLFADALKELKALEQKLTQYEQKLKQKVVRWETIDALTAEDFGRQTEAIQRHAELHRTISEVQGAKTILRGLVKNKKFIRSFTLLGGKIAKLQTALPKFITAADDALAALQELTEEDDISAEDISDVVDTLREEGNDPIALASFLSGFENFESELKLNQINQIADKDLRKRVTAIVRDLFEDIVVALSAGDIDGATEAIQDLSQAQIIQELPGLIGKAIAVSKMKKRKAKDLTKILDQFKALDAALDAADAEDAGDASTAPAQ